MSAVGKILYRVLRDEHAASEKVPVVSALRQAQGVPSQSRDGVSRTRRNAHDSRGHPPRPERHRVLSQDAGGRVAAALRCSSCSISASLKLKKGASCSPPSPRSASTTAPAWHTAGLRRRCSTPRSGARSTHDAGRQTVHDPRVEGELTRPLTREAGTVRCEARVVHVGGRTAASEGRIVDATANSTPTAHNLHRRGTAARNV